MDFNSNTLQIHANNEEAAARQQSIVRRGLQACDMHNGSVFWSTHPAENSFGTLMALDMLPHLNTGESTPAGISPHYPSEPSAHNAEPVSRPVAIPHPLQSQTIAYAQTSRIVPQRVYVALKQTPRPELPQEIAFTCYGDRGIPVAAVLSGNLPVLDGGDSQDDFASLGQKATYRIEWPGYEGFSLARHVKKKNRTETISRRDIVLQIAEVTKAFVEKCPLQVFTLPTDEWRIGPGHIQLEHIIITGVNIVSVGSVQPILAIRQ